VIQDSHDQYGLSQRKDPFIAGKEDHEILIVYPFEGAKKEIEATASDLNELSYKGTYDSRVTTEMTSRVGRSHVTIVVEDYEKLEAGMWLNDTLIDFWMQWISRDLLSNDVHFFTSHFHSTLESDGVEGVKSWVARNNINIFEKKLIFIPSCRELHWSLCVIVNPGAVDKSRSNLISVDEDDRAHSPISCILFFDSLNLHKRLSSQILLLKWLNYEWQRVYDSSITPFTRKSCIIYHPEGMFELPRIVIGFHCKLTLIMFLFNFFTIHGCFFFQLYHSPNAKKWL